MPVNRREFLITLAGAAIGTVALSPAARAVPAGEAMPTIRLVTLPTKTPGEDGEWFLLWSEETEDGVESMMWHPETPEELADAKAFYEAAINHEGVEGVRQQPKTIAGKVARFFSELAEADPRKRSDEEWKLLRAIIADPEDEAPLLRYADWLSAKGSPQGEFIRVDRELDGMSFDDPRRPPRDARWTELYEAHGKDFVEPLQKLGLAPVIGRKLFPALSLVRGVIGSVEINKPGIVPEKLDDLFAVAPLIDQLSLDFPKVRLAELAQRPQMAQIRSLSISGLECGIDARALEALARSRNTGRLRELDLAFNEIGPAGAAWLGKSPFLPRLRSLSLQSCRIGPDGLRHLLAGNSFENLRKLALGNNDLDGESVGRLAECRSLRTLEHLDLCDNGNAWDGLPLLPQASFAGSVKELIVNRMNPVSAEVTAFARGRYASLEHLDFRSSRLEDEGLAALAETEWFAGLKTLELPFNNDLTPKVGEILARVPFQRLETLELSEAPLGDDGIGRLVRSPHLRTLKTLDLSSCGVTRFGVQAIVTAALPRLERLRLHGNAIGPEGAKLLVDTQKFQLTDLWVDKESVGNSGRKQLRKRYGDAMSFR